jgi:hypothetical protein
LDLTFAACTTRNDALDERNDLTDFPTYLRDTNIKFWYTRMELRTVDR